MKKKRSDRKYRVFGYVELDNWSGFSTQKYEVKTGTNSMPICTCNSPCSAGRIASALNQKEGRTRVEQ